jgi:hypothetical protein
VGVSDAVSRGVSEAFLDDSYHPETWETTETETPESASGGESTLRNAILASPFLLVMPSFVNSIELN